MIRQLINDYALIKLYGYYYTVLNCTLSTLNEDILILLFESYLLLNQYILEHNIELPITYLESII